MVLVVFLRLFSYEALAVKQGLRRILWKAGIGFGLLAQQELAAFIGDDDSPKDARITEILIHLGPCPALVTVSILSVKDVER